jgi:hypothetical protein
MDIIIAISDFIYQFLFTGWAGENVILAAVDPVTIVLVGMALYESGDKAVDAKRKAELERKIGYLNEQEKALLLEKAQKAQNKQAQVALILQEVELRDQLDKKKENVGIAIGIGGILIAVILIYVLTKKNKK